jgi:hypothetical protein
MLQEKAGLNFRNLSSLVRGLLFSPHRIPFYLRAYQKIKELLSEMLFLNFL